MSQEKFGFIRELTLPELWQLSYAIQERIRTLSMAPTQVWHIEIQQTGGYQPGLDQVVPPCPKWYLGDGTTVYTKGATVSSPAPSGEGPNSDTKSDTTLSDRVQASKLYDDPWEGSGACPARWERPFYQGAQIYAPREYPVQPGFVRRSNPGEPQFGGEAGQDLAVKRGKDATWQ